MDIFIISQALKYILIGIAIGFLLFFLSISFFIYLNGREINEYYLIFFGKLKRYDIVIITTMCLLFSIFCVVLNYDNILIDAKKQQLIYNILNK